MVIVMYAGVGMTAIGRGGRLMKCGSNVAGRRTLKSALTNPEAHGHGGMRHVMAVSLPLKYLIDVLGAPGETLRLCTCCSRGRRHTLAFRLPRLAILRPAKVQTES